MVEDFQSFMNRLLGGASPAPTAAPPTPSRVPTPRFDSTPLVTPTVRPSAPAQPGGDIAAQLIAAISQILPENDPVRQAAASIPNIPNPYAAAAAPVMPRVTPQPTRVLSPRDFTLAQSGDVQGPTFDQTQAATPGKQNDGSYVLDDGTVISAADMNGKWYTVWYTPAGSSEQMMFVVPESRMSQVPSGATYEESQIFQGADRVERAIGTGKTLFQQAPDVQAVFLTPTQVTNMTGTGAINQPAGATSEEMQLGIEPNQEPTTVPIQGPIFGDQERPYALNPESSEAQELYKGIMPYEYRDKPTVAPTQVAQLPNKDLVKTLQQAGINEIPQDTFVIQNKTTGEISIVPNTSPVTDGYTILTSGPTALQGPVIAKKPGEIGSASYETDEQGNVTKVNDVVPGYDVQMDPNDVAATAAVPPLTTSDLWKTDPVKASQLINNGITEIQYNQMVVTNPDGSLSVVPYSADTPSDQVFIYGPTPPTRDKGDASQRVFDVFDLFTAGAASLATGNPEPLVSWLQGAGEVLDSGRQWVVSQNVSRELAGNSPVWNFVMNTYDNTKQVLGVVPGLDSVVAVTAAILTGGRTDLHDWMETHQEQVNNVLTYGYDSDGDGIADFTGERAVWEAYINDQSILERIYYDAVNDPFTLLSVGGSKLVQGGRAVLGTSETVPLWRSVLAGTISGAGEIMKLPDAFIDDIVTGAISTGAKIGTLPAKIPAVGRILSKIFDSTAATKVATQANDIGNFLRDVMERMNMDETRGNGSKGQQTIPGTGPTQTQIGAPSPTGGAQGSPLPNNIVPQEVGPTSPTGGVQGTGATRSVEITLPNGQKVTVAAPQTNPGDMITTSGERIPNTAVDEAIPTSADETTPTQTTIAEPTYTDLSPDGSIRQASYPDGRTVIERRNANGAYEELMTESEARARVAQPASSAAPATPGNASVNDPFAGTPLEEAASEIDPNTTAPYADLSNEGAKPITAADTPAPEFSSRYNGNGFELGVTKQGDSYVVMDTGDMTELYRTKSLQDANNNAFRLSQEYRPKPKPAASTVEQTATEAPTAQVVDSSPLRDDEYPQWGIANPRRNAIKDPEGARSIATRAYEIGQTDPAAFREFQRVHNEKAQAFDRLHGELHADAERLIEQRKSVGKASPQFASISRAIDADVADQAIAEARYVVNDLIPDFQRAFPGEPLPEHLNQKLDIDRPLPKDDTPEARKARNIRNYSDERLIHTAIFSDNQKKAEGALRELNARANGRAINADKVRMAPSPYLNDIIAEVPQLRQSYRESRLASGAEIAVQPTLANPLAERTPVSRVGNMADVSGSQRVPQTSPPTRAAGQQSIAGVSGRSQNIPLSEITTARESPNAVPANFDAQMRSADYAEQSVSDITSNYRPDLFDDIIVTPGQNGQYVVLSGHSRLEAARRMGWNDIPARVATGTPDELLSIARRSNTLGTELNVVERGRNIVNRMRDEGLSIKEIAAQEKISGTLAQQYADLVTLPSDLQDLAAKGILPANMGSEISRAIREGLIEPSIAQRNARVWLEQGLSVTNVRDMFSRYRDARDVWRRVAADKEAAGGGGLFATSDYLDPFSVVQDTMLDLVKTQKALQKQINTLEAAARIATPSAEQLAARDLLKSQVADLRAKLDNPELMIPEQSVADDAARTIDDTELVRTTEEDLRRAQENGQRGFFDIFSEESQKLGITNRNALVDTLRRQVPVEPVPTEVVFETGTTSVQRFRGRVLSDYEAQALNTKLKDGSTLGERWDRYADDYEADGMDWQSAEQQAYHDVMNEYVADILQDISPKRYQTYLNEVEHLTTRKTNTLTLTEAQPQAIAKALRGTNAFVRVYDNVLGALREMALYNWVTGLRYIATQAVGNTMTLLLTGHGDVAMDALRLTNVRSAYEYLAEHPAGLIQSSSERLYYNLGISNASRAKSVLEGDPMGAVGGLVKDQVSVAGNDLRVRSFADKLRLGKLSVPFADRRIRDMAAAFDLSFRESLWAHTVSGNIAIATPQFKASAYDRILNKSFGVTSDDLDLFFENLPDVFSSDDVRSLGDAIGMDQKFTDRLARDWQNTINVVNKGAKEEVNRVFFSGNETNADAVLRRVTFFHYWMSRAAPLYVESIAKNPAFLTAYVRMMEAMDRDSQSGQYGAAVDGFVRLFSTPMGFNIFIRPDALVQTFVGFWNNADYSPEGENMLGKFMDSSGFMFNPILQTVVNLSGAMGDTFAPDPLMVGQWANLVTKGLDFAKAYMPGDASFEPTENWYSDALSWLRSKTSGVVPGTDNIPYRDSAVYARRTLNSLIQDVAEERGMDPSSPEVAAIMDDPSNDIYQEAYRRMAAQGALDQAMRQIPGLNALYPKSRVIRPDDRNAKINSLPSGASADDLYQERTYANITDSRSRQLTAQQDQYYDIGRESTQDASSKYNQIRYGEIDIPVQVGGTIYMPDQIARMPDEQRGRLADAWLYEQGQTENVGSLRDQRNAFSDQNQEWANYQDWANDARRFEGGPEAYWQALIQGNPNAKRWYLSLDPNLTPTQRQQKLTSVEAYKNQQGIQPNYNDPNPTSVRDMSNVPYSPTENQAAAETTTTSGTAGMITEQSLTDEILGYQQKQDEYNAILTQIYGAPMDINNLNPMARSAIISNIEDAYGVTPPSLPGHVKDYIQWMDQQEEGADTSIAAYLDWRASFIASTVGAPIPTSADAQQIAANLAGSTP